MGAEGVLPLVIEAGRAIGASPGVAVLLLLLALAARWLLRERRDAMAASIAALESALDGQAAEIKRLAERMIAATEAEERCLNRLRLVRADVHELRNAMQRAGMTLPPLPSDLAAAHAAGAAD